MTNSRDEGSASRSSNVQFYRCFAADLESTVPPIRTDNSEQDSAEGPAEPEDEVWWAELAAVWVGGNLSV